MSSIEYLILETVYTNAINLLGLLHTDTYSRKLAILTRLQGLS